MATLVLTAVGTAIGGPIGGAIGAILGQVVDRNTIFKPRGRQGPRLTDLSVQTSSYGAQIPRLYGRMRVAGSVIWSTDLIESKSKRGAKGQPSVTTYSYSASFAVLLSARPINGVGRIWADGNLLRGANGDFKTHTGFRLHLGSEDQPVDPLIAAAEGAAMTPALRGQAYAVFEQFQLGDYGNRIPSLTFEVIADAAPVAIGAIADDLAEGAVDGRAITATLPGFSAYGDNLRAVLESLADIASAWFVPSGDGLAMQDATAAPIALGDSGYAAAEAQRVVRSRAIAAIETVPQTVSVSHYDPARDYQIGVQQARRPGTGRREDRIDLAAAIEAGPARAIAERILIEREAGRERRQLQPGLTALTILPGRIVTIAGEAGRWRVRGWALEAMALTLDLARLPEPAAAEALPGTSGRVLASPDIVQGATIVHAFELPSLDDTLLTTPRVLVAAAGRAAGWRRAGLLVSTDDGARWSDAGGTALPAMIGTLVDPVAAAPSTLRDLDNEIVVALTHAGMALESANDRALDGGANLALIGNELLQFGVAEQIDAVHWRLRRLLRGRRGTEWAAGTQMAGDRFVLIEADALSTIALPAAAIGLPVRIMASGIGDTTGPAETALMLTGSSVRPPAPVHIDTQRVGSGDLTIRWARRSRLGWRWIDGADAPLGEEQEAYRLTITTASGPPRTIDLAGAGATLAAAAVAPGDTIALRQSGTIGESPARMLTAP